MNSFHFTDLAMTSNSYKNCQWNNLPVEILVEICSYLNIEDRKIVCSTCKSWSNAVYTPVLWRSFTLELEDDAIPNNGHSFWVASNFGHWLKYLKIFIVPDNEIQAHSIAFTFLVDFLKILLETNQLPNLEQFCIMGVWTEICRSDIYEEAILTTAQFLRTQKNLITFSAPISTSIINGALLLDSIDTQSLSSLRILDATDIFTDILTVVDISCVSEILQRFLKKATNLTEVYLEWRYFGETLLSVVAHNCKNTLKYIYLKLDNDCNPKISVELWENVISLIPDLRIGFLIAHRDNLDLPLLKELLPSNLPIKDLYIFDDSIPPEFLQYFCQNFSNTLEILQLMPVDDDGLPVDNEILNLISSCSKLRILTFDGKIKANSITSIIELRIQRVIGLQYLAIRMKNSTVEEYEKATCLNSYYENIIKSENIPFQFYISHNAFSSDADEEDSYSDANTVEEEEEELTESSSEEEEEEDTESSSEEEEEEVTESSSEEEEEEDTESSSED